MSLRRATALATLLLGLAAALPATAAADGDPASDVLLSADVYLPFYPAASKPVTNTLVSLVKQVKQRGFPLKVAIIAGRGDLGAYPNLFNQPQRYADLLTQEIAFAVRKSRLLVVMPGGFGGENLGPKVDQALGSLSIDSTHGSNGLVRTAITAVARLATANGHPTAVPKVAAEPQGAASASGKGSSHTNIYIAAGLFVIAGIALTVLLSRRRAAREAASGEHVVSE